MSDGPRTNPKSRFPRLLAVALASTLVLSACSADDPVETAASETTGDSSETTATPTSASTTETPPETEVSEEPDTSENAEPAFELDGELDLSTQEINDMVAFVEEATGREFLRKPSIVVQTIEEFEADLTPTDEDLAAAEAEAEPSARYLQAIGHTTLGVDELFDALHELGSSTDLISGRYDPETDVVYVPEDALVGDDFNAILVHELVHALDGQHVDLVAAIETLEDTTAEELGDTGFSIRATVEGRATAVQGRWMIANNVVPSTADIPESFSSVPASVINSVVLPYQLGAQTIEGLGGASATWELYDDYPTSSEQMIFADRIGTDLPVEVATPAYEGELFSQGVLGAEGLALLLLGNTFTPSQVTIAITLEAIEGWGGDRFVVSGDETQSCLTADIVADSPADLGELETALVDWASEATTEGAERTATVDGETLTITACAPFTP